MPVFRKVDKTGVKSDIDQFFPRKHFACLHGKALFVGIERFVDGRAAQYFFLFLRNGRKHFEKSFIHFGIPFPFLPRFRNIIPHPDLFVKKKKIRNKRL